jgi:ubiquinone/menaquinone biosynthesis C-methylase UbiE
MQKRIKNALVILCVLGYALPAFGSAANSRGGYGYRESVNHVLEQMDLEEGFVVADIGAGDGWWAQHMAKRVGATGVVHAGDVVQNKVDAMKRKYAEMPQLKPYLCPLDGTGLPADSCDRIFLSKTYHHLEEQVKYLGHLLTVAKASGRLVVIERHPDLAAGEGKKHAWMPGKLIQQAEEAGWLLLHYEMIPESDHFMTVFVKPSFLIEQIP